MFTGSGNVPYGLHDKLTEGVGGQNNGTTNNDRTNYYETVPSNYLESALWLEADRMGFLLDSLDLAKLNAQRDIVKNERRQGVDNQPYGRAGEILAQGDLSGDAPVFVGGHRQHGGPLGRVGRGREEFLPALLRAEQRLSRRSSATSIRRRRRRGSRSTSATSRAASRSRGRRSTPVTLHGREAARLRGPRAGAAALHPVADGRVKHDDRFALDVLGAILAGARTARLTKALVYDEQAAASVPAGQSTNEDVGEFSVMITPRPGHTLTDARSRDRRDHRAAQEGRADGRGDSEGDRRRGAHLRQQPRVESRQGVPAVRRRRVSRRRRLLPHRLPEDAGGHGRRRQARRQQVSDRRPRRAERRADGQARSGRQAGPEQARDRLRHEETGRWEMKAVGNAGCRRSAVDCAVGAAGARSQEDPAAGEDARAARAGVDEEHARQWRRPHRLREARSAARLLLDHLPRRRRSVRAGGQAGGRVADGGDAERRHARRATPKRCRTRCSCSARR